MRNLGAYLFCLALLYTAVPPPVARGMPGASGAAESGVREKTALISLVEDRLSRAYKVSRAGQLPDFATLDQIYPSWDKGKPGMARREWLEKHYLFYRVKYRVYSVRLTSPQTAEIRGERIEEAIREEPVLHWFHRDDRQVALRRFLIEAYRLLGKGWRIRRETLY